MDCAIVWAMKQKAIFLFSSFLYFLKFFWQVSITFTRKNNQFLKILFVVIVKGAVSLISWRQKDGLVNVIHYVSKVEKGKYDHLIRC